MAAEVAVRVEEEEEEVAVVLVEEAKAGLEDTEGQGGVRTYQLRTGEEAGEVWQPPAAAHGWPSVSDKIPNRPTTKLVPQSRHRLVESN